MIHIEAVDEVFLRIRADVSVHAELSDRFTFTVPGYKFMPSFKSGFWDGKIRIYNQRNQTIYRGLLPEVRKFAEDFEYELTADESVARDMEVKFADPEAISDFTSSLKLKYPPRDFQETGLIEVLENRRCILESATGSGKSLIIYMIMRALAKKRVLLLVPNITLVNQMFNDFDQYSAEDDSWSAENECQRIHGGLTKEINSRVVISTWQSVFRSPKQYFEDFDVLLVDECHLAEGNSIKAVAEKCSNARYRVGLTGTLKDSKCSELVLKGLLGPARTISRTRELMDRGILADLAVKMIYLKYPKTTCDLIKKAVFRDELLFTFRNEERNNFLANLALNCDGNTLMLVSEVAEHALPLFQKVKSVADKKQVFLLTAATPPEERERLRKLAETRNDVVFISTYSLFSTGVNIVNLKNVIFAGPAGKSEIRVLQSVGRGLRKGEGKDKAVLIDIVDDYSNGKAKKNTLFKHAMERCRYYIEQDFETKTIELTL